MKVEVTSCHDCPLCNSDMEKGSSCNYPGNDVEDYQMPQYDDNWMPSSCPLIKNSMLVEKSKSAAVNIEFKRTRYESFKPNKEEIEVLSEKILNKDGNEVDCWDFID